MVKIDAATIRNVIDLVRIVAGGVAGVMLCIVSYIIAHYIRLRRERGGTGLLIRHVLLVGLSYISLLIYATCDITSRIGGPLTWRLPIATVALLLGLPSILLILHHVYRRDHFL